MVEITDTDYSATRLFLLAHIDPHVVMNVTGLAARYPEAAATPNMLLFANKIDISVRSLLRRLAGGALANQFTREAITVIEQSHLEVDPTGLAVLRSMDQSLDVIEPPEPNTGGFAGAVRAPDAVCDLLLQPLMALSNLFAILAEDWIEIAAMPEVAQEVYYRTNKPNFFEARLENRIRLELGLPVSLHASRVLNVP